MSKLSEQLDHNFLVELDATTRWGTILVTEGAELPFSPETLWRLQVFLHQQATDRSMALSETYIAVVMDNVWLSIVAFHRDDYKFSPEAMEKLRVFLDSVLGPVIEGRREEDAS